MREISNVFQFYVNCQDPVFQNQRTKDNALAAADVHCVENSGTAQQSFKAADNAIRDIDI